MKNLIPKLLLISLVVYLIVSVTSLGGKQHYSVNNQEIGISQLVESDPIVIDGDDTLENQAASGSGTLQDPYIISNKLIVVSTPQHGIMISGTTKYIEIRNNYISTGNLIDVVGIYIEEVPSGTINITDNILEGNYVGIQISAYSTSITFNTISNSQKFAIEVLDGSDNSRIHSNDITLALKAGINIEGAGSIVSSNNIRTPFTENSFSYGIGIHRNDTTILENRVEGYWEGINLSPVSNAKVLNNTILNSASGITGWPSNSQISNNIITNGLMSGDGIRLQGETINWKTDNNLINWNFIKNFPGFGFMALDNSNNNVIQNNFFVGNSYATSELSQGFDNGSGNFIDNNYWDEWISPDDNSDGIVDVPYSIVGKSKNEDNQPVVSMELLQSLNNQNIETSKSNIVEEAEADELISTDLVLNPLVLLSAFMVVLSFPIVKVIKLMANNTATKLIKGTLSDMIGFAPPFLVGVINSNQDNKEEFQELVPAELKAYKFLLNPIKLSIIKMLYTYSSYPAYRVREMLQISWGKFSSHVNSLIEKGYISAQEEFYDGSPTKILRIEYLGTSKYQDLREILKKMFEIVEE